jgi:hypothetical protein
MRGETAGPVVVTVMDRDRMADYMAMVGELRSRRHPRRGLSGQPEELWQPVEIRRQTRQSPVAVIQGGNEAAEGHGDPEGPDPGRQDRRKRHAGGMEGPPRAGGNPARRSGGGRAQDAGRMIPKAAIRAEAERLHAAFVAAGRRAGRGRYPVARRNPAGPLRRGHPRAGLCHRRPAERRDDAAPRFHRAGGAGPYGAWRRPGALCLHGRGVPQAGTSGRPGQRIPAGRLRGLRPRRPEVADAEVFALFPTCWRA